MKTNKRILEMDALRGIASLAVVFFHYTTRYEELFNHVKQPYPSFSYGSLGVKIFFIMSGFVIFISLNNAQNIKEFFIKRFIRLYPAYIFAVILIYIVVSLYGLEGRQVSMSDAVINLTMLQGHIPRVLHVDGAFWTLTIELTFLVIMGISFYRGITKNIVSFSFSWLLISSSVMIINLLFSSPLTNYIKLLSISEYSHLFIAGIIFYYLKQHKNKKYYSVLVSCLIYEFIFINSISSNIAVVLFFSLFYLMINNKLRFLAVKPLIYLGAISYQVYLLHQNIGYVIINILERNGLVHEIYLGIPIIVTIILAVLLNYYVEKPIQRWLRFKAKPTPLLKKNIVKN